MENDFTVSVNASDNTEGGNVTLQSLAKYRNYRFKVAAVTNAGVGEYTHWKYAMTLAGSKKNTLMTNTLMTFLNYQEKCQVIRASNACVNHLTSQSTQNRTVLKCCSIEMLVFT